MKRTQQEIKQAIEDQLTYIKNSCYFFDNNQCLVEGIRIAAALNVLVEIRRESKGLLHQFEDLKLISTSPITEEKELGQVYCPLVKFSEHCAEPAFDSLNYPVWLCLDEWLKQTIYSDTDEQQTVRKICRHSLINTARDKDGGGHFDLKLSDKGYRLVKHGQTIAVGETLDEPTEYNTQGFHLYMLRQLAYEVLESGIIETLGLGADE